MAFNRVQTLRSSSPGVRPSGQLPGTLYTNWSDNQLGVVSAAGAAVDLLAVRYFSSLANYVVGDHVVQGGVIYRATAPSSPGAFVPGNWSALVTAATTVYLPVAGGTMTGPIVLSADPAAPLQPVTLQYLQAQGFLPKAGGTMTGPIVLAADPAAALQSATKQYVDNSTASIVVGDVPPPSPPQGKLWFDSTGAQLYVNYNDGNSSQWVIAVNTSQGVPVAATALPIMDGIAAVGTSAKWAREDHVHPRAAVGVIDGSDAAAGQIGEFLSQTTTSNPITSATPTTYTSLTLTPGDWEVWGQGTLSAGATVCSAFLVGISGTINTLGSNGGMTMASASIGAGTTFLTPRIRSSSNVSATVYITLQANFTPGAVSAVAAIYARRVR